ncbi:FAD-binding domain protein [Ceratobasidium sp. AG-Ba]|nr:FAD-binding domain protein [Ceratobasidium sp. AG-Ba]
MFKFSEVTYHPAAAAADGSVGTVDVGSGLVWDDVYAALQPHGVTVVGGRVTGVGVGGFTLGGGYSWLSNQYGLTIDTVTEFEVVLPNGTITAASEGLNPDLFFGLKGGFNNFGIVTKFTLAFPRASLGLKTHFLLLTNSINVTDPKAGIITTYNFLLGQPGVSLNVLRWADAACGLTSLVQASPQMPLTEIGLSLGAFNTVSLKTYSPALIEQVLNQTTYWGSKLSLKGANFISYDVEPFLPTMTSRSKGGAYPHDNYLIPLNLYYAWAPELFDEDFIEAMEESARVILIKLSPKLRLRTWVPLRGKPPSAEAAQSAI